MRFAQFGNILDLICSKSVVIRFIIPIDPHCPEAGIVGSRNIGFISIADKQYIFSGSIRILVKHFANGHIKEISCSAFVDYKIKFIYNRKNPSILYVYDFTGEHGRSMLLTLVFVVLSVITAILFFEMFKSSFDYHRKYQQTMKYAKPLYVHLQNQTSLLSDEGELFELPLVLLSDTGKIRSFLGLLFNLKRRLEHIRVETDDSGLMFLRFDDKLSFMKKCYIYGITESKLREAAELQNFTDDKVKSQGVTSDIKTSQSPVALIDGFQSSDECDGTQATNKNNATTLTNKSDRVIYFAGPWIYSTRKPAKTLKLYITGNEIKDYFIV